MATEATLPAASAGAPVTKAVHDKLNKGPHKLGIFIFLILLAIGFVYVLWNLVSDVRHVQQPSSFAFLMLGVALLVALGFEFVNGFHDTANAVATVIYTHSLDPHIAVAWSGMFNFLGVVVSSGAVAFAIVSLLPVELILQVGSGAGFAMVFALLAAAIIWNLGTWWLGLPASSSHPLIGSIIGVGIANQLMNARTATSGVNGSRQQKSESRYCFRRLSDSRWQRCCCSSRRSLSMIPACTEPQKEMRHRRSGFVRC